jgi:hypothetical protein
MRVPLPLVPFLGAEVSKALGDVTKPQAEVMARELAGEHAAMFLREKHRLGLVAQASSRSPVARWRRSAARIVPWPQPPWRWGRRLLLVLLFGYALKLAILFSA